MRAVLSTTLVLALFGCRATPDDPKEDSDSPALTDADGDGFDQETDCDDADAESYPDAPELCDGADNDCDGTVDEDATGGTTWYTDADGDGYGDAATAVVACEAPAGAVAVADDCNDADAAYNPAAVEDDCADPNDYNCDGSVGFADADGDGYAACQECDDASATVNPGAPEICNEIDDDCDGLADDADDSLDLSTAGTWHTDADADGYGDPGTAVAACVAPEGTVADATDCVDTDPAFNPGAVEEDCTDPNDYNCDGSVGYADADGDGFAACEECDDTSAAVHPGASEVCNAVDDDCDALVDDADDSLDLSTAATWYADADGDTYGDPAATVAACEQPEGTVADAGDCLDTDAAVSPAATEVCNEVDDDCDGLADDADGGLDTTTATTWYGDADGDGYAGAGSTTLACAQPDGTYADATDCDDALAAVNPGAAEVCNERDDDCDSLVDDADESLDVSSAGTWYVDADGDGFGDDADASLACVQPAGTVADASDCDDALAAVNPDAAEVCNDRDDDCDGAVDDADGSLDRSTGETWYADADGDGYGDADAPAVACDAPASYVADATDCDDEARAVNPGAAEVCNGLDDDCDADVDPGLLGSGAECAASSCVAILEDGSADGDGNYYLQGMSGEVFEAYCDMTTDGGGWTLVGSVVNDVFTTGAHNRKWNSYDAWTGASTFGAIDARQTADYKGEAYADVAGYDVLVITDEYAFSFENIVGAQPFADHVAAEYDAATCGTNFLASGADYYDGLTDLQASALSWVIRPHDNNATCFPTGNENAMIGIQLTECCWTPGMGNTPAGYPTWDDYDLSLLKASRLSVQSCSAGDYPCNDNGVQFTNASSDYSYHSKVVYAETYVR